MSDNDFAPKQSWLGPGHDFHLLSEKPPAWQLFRCANEPVDDRWKDARIVDGQWRIYIVDRPGVSLSYSGGTVDYPVDGLMVIPAWLPFTFQFRTRAVHAFIHFELPTCGRPLTEQLWPRPWIWHDQDVLGRFRRLALALAEPPDRHALTHQQLLALEAQSLTACTVAHIIAQVPVANRARIMPGTSDRLAPILARIEANLAGNLAIPALAALINLGEESFIRLFHRTHGQTPTQFIIERRCSRAAQLLLETEHDLDAIAASCGFGSRHYLSRMFSRQHGMAPAAYRRRGKNPLS